MEGLDFNMSVIGHMIGCLIYERVWKDCKAQSSNYSGDEIRKLAREHAQKLAAKIVEDYFKEKK